MTDETKQLSLNIEQPQTDNGPVVCLGMTFKNDDERREYFRNELRKKLPELKKIEGFPIADDEDIIALSDPPYYTACPNPWINDFIEEWEKEKVTRYGRDSEEEYHSEPFASDVSEGKNDPIYNAHFYHTKVPYKAIMKYILHYTKPGDIIFDGFCGSGMAGVAAQMCQYAEEIIPGIDKQKVGTRNSILSDLSPFATFIAKNNNMIGKFNEIKDVIENIIKEIEIESNHLLETNHNGWERGTKEEEKRKNLQNYNRELKGRINYTVWSDVFICENCAEELVYWKLVFNGPRKPLKKELICHHCGAILNKNKMKRKYEQRYISQTNEILEVAKQVPVLINYSYNGKRFEKYPDDEDFKRISELKDKTYKLSFDIKEIPEGFNTNQPKKSHGLKYNFQFLSDLNLYFFNELYLKINNSGLDGHEKHFIQYLVTASLQRTIKLNRYMPNHDRHVGPLSGTLYISQLTAEIPLITYIKDKWKEIEKTGRLINNSNSNLVTTQSSGKLIQIPDNSIDYIFTDPPFGENLNYSELNFIYESFLGVITNNNEEAIINDFQNKSLYEYQKLMEKCFKQMYRILKPGRWITVEFNNSKNSVWNSIQDALTKSGFIIADVRILDKVKGTTKQMSYMNTAKQDLVISAYKPFTNNILKIKQSDSVESAWLFVEQHLQQLPVFEKEDNKAQIIAERTPRFLYDRMVAFHVQNGLPVPLSSPEFQSGVAKRFPMRDGMVFLENQVAEYDKKRISVKEFTQLSLFVSDENSAIEWIRQQLMNKPQTRQELHPEFMKQIQHIAKHEELPELDDLLEQNFLRYDGEEPVPNQILTYLRRNYKDLRGLDPTDPKVIEKAMHRWYVPDPNKQSDLEKLREKALLREFNQYKDELEGNKKKLRTFRTEAIRAGFKNAYKEKDFETIVKVGDRIPEKVIQEDDKLFMFYENAKIRLGL